MVVYLQFSESQYRILIVVVSYCPSLRPGTQGGTHFDCSIISKFTNPENLLLIVVFVPHYVSLSLLSIVSLDLLSRREQIRVTK